MNTRLVVALLLCGAATSAAAQRIHGHVPSNRGFFTPRTVDTSPIHPRARRTNGPIPFPPPERAWVRLDTPHFIVFSSAGERRARLLAEDFENLTALLLQISPFFRIPASRTRVFVFHERRDMQPYLNAVRGGEPVDAIGVTVRHAGGSTMLVDAGARGGETTTPRHELVHELLRHSERPLPLWVEEGVAEYYSNVGRPIQEHIYWLRFRWKFTLPELFAMKSGDPDAFDKYFYAQSWATVATLMRLDEKAFFELLRDLERGIETKTAIENRYGKSLERLAAAMRFAALPTPVILHDQAFEATIRPASRGEILYQLATMLSHVIDGDEEADRHFRASIAAAPNEAEPLARYAEFLSSRERHDEARLTAEEALALASDDPRLYAVLGAATNDVNHLECASAWLPDRADLRLRLFAAYMHRGDRSKADVLFGALTETPKVNDARRILLRADLARADALARDGNTAEAARVLRELAMKMPGKTKTQLEAQAAALEGRP